MPEDDNRLDAGLRALSHYKTRLPRWRYVPRQWLIPIVRWETPYLATFQSSMRSPKLDSYFAIMANLGTHTFFMVFLPILFWMVHILASGVVFSGFVKDLLCLPRPLSPPLQRITMSGSAALEYGFPSTHSTNAVSVTVYMLLSLHSQTLGVSPLLRTCLDLTFVLYAASIVLGRLYCGMHGFFDVVAGSILGAILPIIHFLFIDDFDDFIRIGSLRSLIIVILIVLVLIRIHPEPADDCPCFDDSVAFAGVFCGIEVGKWHFAQTSFSWSEPVPATVPFCPETLGWTKSIARFVLGVMCIFAWREVAKPSLLKFLPPIFRIIERLGLTLPRRFFKPATEYDQVPSHLKTDNVMPPVSEFPNFVSSIRHPRRSRSVSVGPQSAADAYETLVSRQRSRKASNPTVLPARSISEDTAAERFNTSIQYLDRKLYRDENISGFLPTPPLSSLDLPSALSLDRNNRQPLTPNDSFQNISTAVRTPSQDRRENEKEEREIFSKIEKPRVRYDVEVITKLIIYSGIGWIAMEGGPILFKLIGLGC